MIREYWLQADSFLRNIAANGRDDYLGATYSESQTSYQFVGYRAYAPKWQELLPMDADIGGNDGIPGPVIRGRAGDTVVIHFRNNDTHYGFSHSIHAHGLLYTPENDGTWTNRDSRAPGSAVFPGEDCTYHYTVPANAVGSWLYYDYSMPESLIRRKAARNMQSRGLTTEAQPGDPDQQYMPMASELGLFGMVVIENPLETRPDRENIVVFHDLYSDDLAGLSQDFDCINGHSFLSNTPTFQARVGDHVRWRVAALGKEKHVFHIHGHRWMSKGRYTDTLILAPGSTGTIEYIEESPGRWLYHCHVTEHMMGGMAGLYVVTA